MTCGEAGSQCVRRRVCRRRCRWRCRRRLRRGRHSRGGGGRRRFTHLGLTRSRREHLLRIGRIVRGRALWQRDHLRHLERVRVGRRFSCWNTLRGQRFGTVAFCSQICAVWAWSWVWRWGLHLPRRRTHSFWRRTGHYYLRRHALSLPLSCNCAFLCLATLRPQPTQPLPVRAHPVILSPSRCLIMTHPCFCQSPPSPSPELCSHEAAPPTHAPTHPRTHARTHPPSAKRREALFGRRAARFEKLEERTEVTLAFFRSSPRRRNRDHRPCQPSCRLPRWSCHGLSWRCQ